MKVLFFTQNLARTGSEIAIYNLIRNADRQKTQMAVALGEAGELTKYLPADVTQSTYLPHNSPNLLQKLGRRVRYRLPGNNEEWLANFTQEYEGYIWYINTILQPQVLRQARKFGVPCVLHSHELEHMFWNITDEDARTIIEYPKLVIACSTVADTVLRQMGRTENMEICYSTIDCQNIRVDSEKRLGLRNELGIPDHSFVWVMSGSLDPNKNPVLFVELAKAMLDRRADVHFLWLGGSQNGYSLFAKARANHLKISEKISWLRTTADDYYDYLNLADALVLTSQKESFSLVSVEAAYLGKPVIAFNCGGVKEIIKDKMGMVIDSWNFADLVAVMEKVMRGEINFDAGLAREQAIKFDISAQVGHWERTLKQYFGSAF